MDKIVGNINMLTEYLSSIYNWHKGAFDVLAIIDREGNVNYVLDAPTDYEGDALLKLHTEFGQLLLLINKICP